MKLMPVAIGLLASAAVLPAQQSMPTVAPESVGLSSPRLQEATDLLGRFVDERKIAGAVAAVARRGKLAYLHASGVQDLQTRTAMSARTLFRIYSMTKPVTAVAVMMLHEEGRFRLEDPVSKYLPEFSKLRVMSSAEGETHAPSAEVTVRDLLLHTSGLSHRTSELYRRLEVRSRSISLSQFIANITRAPLMEDPGTRYRYSEATTVLGRLVEVWSGKSFDAFLADRVFSPLKMHDTMFWVGPAERPRLTTVYQSANGSLTPIELETVPFTEKPTLLEGAVGLVSTVPDYVRFSQMLLNEGELEGTRILRAATVRSMVVNGLSDPVQKARGGPMGWGLVNVNVVLTPGQLNYPANVGEYGWDGSAGTIFWIDPAEQLVTVLMTQSAPANPDSLRQRFKTIVQQAIVK
jgi:CubicO group peptidase (beta-lactamase class C family)